MNDDKKKLDKKRAKREKLPIRPAGLPQDEAGRIELVEAFTRLIGSCKGRVILRTRDGDKLVADSMLSALIGFKTLLDMADQIQLTFECELQEDEDRIKAFLDERNIRH